MPFFEGSYTLHTAGRIIASIGTNKDMKEFVKISGFTKDEARVIRDGFVIGLAEGKQAGEILTDFYINAKVNSYSETTSSIRPNSYSEKGSLLHAHSWLETLAKGLIERHV